MVGHAAAPLPAALDRRRTARTFISSQITFPINLVYWFICLFLCPDFGSTTCLSYGARELLQLRQLGDIERDPATQFARELSGGDGSSSFILTGSRCHQSKFSERESIAQRLDTSMSLYWLVVVSGYGVHHDATGTTWDVFCRRVCMGSLRLHPHAQTTKKLPTETARPAAPDEHQPGCFALEEEKAGHWTGSGVPVIKEARPTL
jgi:hypothetical protein